MSAPRREDATVLVGVDVGTTAAKAIAFDVRGNAVSSGEAGYPLLEPEPGQAVQDPDVVVEGALRAVRDAVTGARARGARVAGLSLSSAMHALVALDGDDRPLTRIVTWADMRAAEQAERLRRERPELHDRTGAPLHPMAPLPKLVWFAEREPETFAAARRWVGIKELVIARLTGTWAVDHSLASGTGLMNLEALDWDPEALEVAGLGRERLAALVPVKERLALGAGAGAELGLEPGLAVVVGAGDGPLANLGVGAVRPGVAACSIGTSGALRVVVERPAIDPARRVFCYALTPGRWVVGGAINNGGVVLQWVGEALAPDLGAHAEEALVALAAEAPPGSDGLIMLPYLLSERAPHWSSEARGAYVGLTHRHGRAHLVRAALEGVCQQLALVLASMRDAGDEVREVRATGGFARSALWRQMLADALGMPVGFPSGHEGSAFGAALLGMEALGLVETIELAADLVEIDEVVQPGAAAATYADLLPAFAALYDALAPTFPVLARHETRRRRQSAPGVAGAG
ncbi:MAG TPA: gluconokinase [Solirubrobacteraceae bacterium]